MIVMLGEFTGKRVPMIQRHGWGRMWIARGRNIYTYPAEPWGFDNGAYRDYSAGVPFNATAYLKSLDRAAAHPGPPYLAVLPDIPMGGEASLVMSLEWMQRLRSVPFPWYIAVQDGLEPKHLAPFVDEISGCFLGGSNKYKATAGVWCEWAHANGLRMHYGRCGTVEKVRQAQHIGADSIDSAAPMWTEQRWRLFESTVNNGPTQRDLFMEAP